MIFQLVQIAIGHRKKLSRSLSEKEWWRLYDYVVKQAVAGICFAGVEKLPKEQWPPQELLYEWIGTAEQIKQQNAIVDKLTAEMWEQLKEDGLEAVVLKGQGIATFYGHTEILRPDGSKRPKVELTDNTDHNADLSTLRQSGDIDIWVLGGYQKVCDYVQRTYPTDDVAYHRFHYDAFPDIEVELHHRPTLMRNLLDDRKLARWYNSFKAEDFVYLEDKGFAVPPASFNVIFILTHIYRHFLFEGIGLRQVMDYYFVLKGHTVTTDSTDIISLAEKEEIAETLEELRLMRFAEAMMWILHTQFGLERQYLICEMNEKEGRFVLDEILQTGNFGQADSRYQFKRWYKLRHHIAHSSHLLLHYPSEVLWTPVWLIYHKMWKWEKKRKIRKSWK